MDWMETVVHTTTEAADLVSEIFLQCGAKGTAIEDRNDVPHGDSRKEGFWEIVDPNLTSTMSEDVLVKGWFSLEQNAPECVHMLSERLKLLPKTAEGMDLGTLEIETKSVKEQNWAESWKRFYKPFRAGEHIVVKPSWEPYEKKDGDMILEIDPGMAFGSGTHETTFMCLTMIEKYMKKGARVIDIGTGSGILAMAASMCGAGDVLAIDLDPMAVKVAAENVEKSGLAGKIRVQQGDLLERVDETCDIAVANIIADVICALSSPVKTHIAEGGLFICSGIIREREDDVLSALAAAEYSIVEIMRKGEWIAVCAKR